LYYDLCPPKSTVKITKKRRIGRGALVRASVDRSTSDAGRTTIERVDGARDRSDGVGGAGFTGSAMEVTTFNQNFGDGTEFPVWDKIGAVVRLSYGIGNFFRI